MRLERGFLSQIEFRITRIEGNISVHLCIMSIKYLNRYLRPIKWDVISQWMMISFQFDLMRNASNLIPLINSDLILLGYQKVWMNFSLSFQSKILITQIKETFTYHSKFKNCFLKRLPIICLDAGISCTIYK